MKVAEIRERTDAELKRLVEELHEDLYKARVKKATNQLDDTSLARRLRRDIARIHTVLRARELGIETPRR